MSLAADVVRYSDLWGPSGAEQDVIRAFKADLEARGLEPRVDTFGNVTATLRAADPGYPTVMLSAHLDEVGFVVRKIEPDGFLRLHRVGGTHDRVVAGQRLRFRTPRGDVVGAVGVKAKHVSTPQELASAVTIDDAYVDVLAPDRAAAEAMGLEVGTLGTFDAAAEAAGDYLRGKALDDRAGVATLLAAVDLLREHPPRAGVVVLGSVQEEFSVRGGVVAARRLAPDLALCLDIAIATDTPDLAALGDVRLGGGPVVTRFTRALLNGIIPHPELVRRAREAADLAGVTTQNAVLQGGLTDGSFMQYAGDGIPTLDLSFATRYTHTPVETVHLGDLEGLARLVAAFAEGLDEGMTLARG